MKAPEIPDDEEERLAELRALEVLDTAPEPVFDDLTRLAAEILEVPIALISLVDSDRQWFKARFGLDAPETSREVSFCGHVVVEGSSLVVPDATRDERFADNPLVAGAPDIRFYAGMPLRMPSGQVLGTLCAIDQEVREITPAKLEALHALARQVVSQLVLRRRTKELERARGLQDAILKSAAFSIISTDPEGTISSFNAEAERLLGYTADEMVGKRTPADFHLPEEVARRAGELTAELGEEVPVGFEAFVAKARRGEADVQEWTYVARDGRHFPVVLSVTAMHGADGTLVGFLGIARDISLRREAEVGLRDLGAYSDAVLNAAREGILTLTPVGTIESANPAACELLGRREAELVGGELAGFLAEEDGERFRSALGDEMLTTPCRLVEAQEEYLGERPDGTTLPLEVSAGALETHEGPRLAVLLRDVSEARAAEKAKDQFISTVSHELRTPLTSIRGSLGLLDAGVAGELPEKAAEMVGIALSNSERLIRLVNDILDIERLRVGGLQLVLGELRPGEVVRDSLGVVQAMARELGVAIRAPEQSEVSLRPLPGDRERVTQVLVNLLSNALKFSPEGAEVEVTVEGEDGGGVRFAVLDRGPGIAAADRERIFGRFQQVDATDRRARQGSGLGLAICQALVREHGGEIGVEPRPGGGSVFWFRLPGAGSESRPVAEGDWQVLHVEDDPDLAVILEAALESEGFGVTRAATLAAARDQLAARRFDAVLLDVALPDGSGLELTEGEGCVPMGTPVIVVSGSHQGGRLVGDAHSLDWLVKPVRGEDLAELLRRRLRGTEQPRVLVVEDDRSTRHVVLEQLRSLGIECEGVGDGPSAVRRAQETPPDLIVLDVSLPWMDGFQVVSTLREGPLRTVPLIVYSARDLDLEERRRLELGATRFLTKARHRGEDLLSHVRELLHHQLSEPPPPGSSG